MGLKGGYMLSWHEILPKLPCLWPAAFKFYSNAVESDYILLLAAGNLEDFTGATMLLLLYFLSFPYSAIKEVSAKYTVRIWITRNYQSYAPLRYSSVTDPVKPYPVVYLSPPHWKFSLSDTWRKVCFYPADFFWPGHFLLLGSFSNYDGDGSETVKTAIGLLSKITGLDVHHAFLYIS